MKTTPRYQVRSFGYAYVVDTYGGIVRRALPEAPFAFKTWDEAQKRADELNAASRVRLMELVS